MAGHRIDVHHHFYPPDLKDVLGGGPTRDWTPQSSLDEMDANEFASVALSASSIPTAWWRHDDDWLRKTVRRFNEFGAEMVKDRPDRFGLFAFLSMRDVDGSLAEIEYAFDTLHADGVGIATSFGDKWPGDGEFAPIFDELDRRGALVYIQPDRARRPARGGAGEPNHVRQRFSLWPHRPNPGRARPLPVVRGRTRRHREGQRP